MSTTLEPVTHVCLDDRGRAWIEGTTMKVIELICGVVAYGWNAEDLGRQYPHLTPGQIHSALAYYYDHQSSMDAELDRITRDASHERQGAINSPLRERLRALGKIS